VDCADGQIHVSALLSSVSVHESQVAIPFAKLTVQRVTNLYYVMDASYDVEVIREYSNLLGHVPIIDHNFRRCEKMKMDPAT
jgi:hypothetical protein